NHTLLVARDGTERPIADSAAPIRDENGSVIGVVLVFHDQTEERDAQRALIESEERLRLALTAANQGLYDINIQTGECVVNPEYARMLGYDPIEFSETNTAWLERLHPDDREEVYRTYEDYVAGRRDEYRVEYRQLTKSGDWKWILSHGKIVSLSADGHPLRMLGTYTDITERKRAEEALRETERFLRSTLDGLSANIALLDEQGKILLVNKAWREFAENNGIISVSAVSEGSNYLRICDSAYGESSEEAGPFAECIRAVLSGVNESYALEYPCHSPDKKRWFVGRITPFPGGGPRRVVVAHEDITERKQAELRLTESEHRYRTLADSGQALIWTAGLDKKRNYFNLSWLVFTGRTMEQEMGDGWAEGVHPEDLTRCFEDYSNAFDRRELFSIIYRLRRDDGEYRWIQDDGMPRYDTQGNFLGYIGHCLDITENKLAEMELRESEERYRALVEVSSEAMLLRNSEGRIVYANPSALALLHATTAEDLVGQDYLNLVHPEDREESAKRVQRSSMENQPAPKREHRLITLDGQLVYVESTGVPLKHQGQQHVLGVFQDLTTRKRLEKEHKKTEAQFRQAQKMEAVGRLAGGVAHDFNNMLGVILGFTDLAITKLPADDPVKMYLDEVKSAAQRSADITRQLLAFARKQIIAPKLLDLNDTIASMLKMLRRLIGEDIDLLWKPANDLWPVKMDPAQIDQVLANLMVNARDAIAGVGKITIETGKVEFDERYCEANVGFIPGRYVLLTVSDDGCGMDKETLAQLFEPFFTTKEVGEGTGLGMATIYGIVKQNNGFINVYSEPGLGTAFKIYLPRQEPQEAAPEQPRKPAEVPTGTETVLLVEDEKSLLKFARMLLEELGYTVLAAGSPREAIQLVKEYTNEIHLLMTDVVMPEMSGRDLWIQLNASQPGLKCLF
ncbi:MAG: PAS domain S-box protein, partial [Nitrospira sp.]